MKLGNLYKTPLMKQQEIVKQRLAHLSDSHSSLLMTYQKIK